MRLVPPRDPRTGCCDQIVAKPCAAAGVMSLFLPLLGGVLLVACAGCDASATGAGGSQAIIRVEGSDTMVNVAQAWAERYHHEYPHISVQVLGGGSGVGIASLTDGNCDLANSSRDIHEKEIVAIRAKRGADPVEHIVGYDALAVYVHPDNPLESISLEELAEIFGEGGTIARWSQLGILHSRRGRDTIGRIGRQNSSGTYSFFREKVLGKQRDFKLGSVDRSGSKDVVALVSRTPLAIGYSGMGYAMPGVKMLSVSERRGGPAVEPRRERAQDFTYPLTRGLQVYTAGEPSGPPADFLAWMVSPKGQAIVAELGYVPWRE
jgi:phosphate transport system substrate-binding protein